MTSTVKEKMTASLTAAKAIAEKAEAERRDLSKEEIAEAGKHLKAYQAEKDEFLRQEKLTADSSEVKAMLDQLGDELNLERAHGTEQPQQFKAAKGSLGQQFVESPQYKALAAQAVEGRFREKQSIRTDPMGVKSLIFSGGDTAPAGELVLPTRDTVIEMLGRRPLTVRDLINVRQTTSDTVEYVRQTVQPTAAAVVAEARTDAAPTVADGKPVLAADGGYKPQGEIAFTVVRETVRTIAEWVAATKRSIADAAQLRGIIDDELRADIARVEEDEILNGSGDGEHLRGILQTSGIQTQAKATFEGVDPLLVTTLKAKTKVRTVGRSVPSGFLLNPEDVEAIQLARIAKNPVNEALAGTVLTLHGLPVVESEAIPAGVGLVGDFTKATLWDREQASIAITDSHADFFIRNLVAILAEERVAFGVRRPQAFVKMTLR